MRYKAVICDLDGTLLNTLEDLMDSVNYGLLLHGKPKISLEQTRRYVGNGVAKLIERAVPQGTTKEEEAEILAKFKSYYDKHSKDKTMPYEGILDMLKTLKANGMKLAIVSNKINSAVGPLAEEYFEGLIDVAIGETKEVPKKPAPDMIYKALSELGIEKQDAVFIGDSDVDVETGINSGVDMITVLWGFRDREELENVGATVFIERPQDLFMHVL